MTRSGFVAVAGRPNVGKSTLVNALVGAKVAVTSDKPQTTRRAIRGIATGASDGEPWQLVLVDLPGVQSPRDVLTERMQRRVERELGQSDAALFVLNGAERSRRGRPVHRGGAREGQAARRGGGEQGGRDVARPDGRGARAGRGPRGGGRGRARDRPGVRAEGIAGRRRCATRSPACCPRGRSTSPAEQHSDQPLAIVLAELVREQALKRTREEVPHSIEVQVEELDAARGRADRRARRAVGRDRVPEGDPDRDRRADGARHRHRRAARRSSASSARRAHLDLTVRVRKPLAPRRGPARPARDRARERARTAWTHRLSNP